MGSATREALATARGALSAEKGVTAGTAASLFTAARALAGSAQLRGALADPAVSAGDKSGLVGRVFGSADAAALRLLGVVAESRWSTPDELVDGVEELGIRAAAASAETASIESELFSVGRVIAGDAELELALGSKLGDPAAKAELIGRLFARDAAPATLTILQHLVQSPRGRRVGEMIRTAATVVADAGGRLVATVTTAAPLSAAQLRRLGTTIQAQYGRPAEIDQVIDPAVLGGLRVQVGDEVVDGTVAARLADLRLQLAG